MAKNSYGVREKKRVILINKTYSKRDKLRDYYRENLSATHETVIDFEKLSNAGALECGTSPKIAQQVLEMIVRNGEAKLK